MWLSCVTWSCMGSVPGLGDINPFSSRTWKKYMIWFKSLELKHSFCSMCTKSFMISCLLPTLCIVGTLYWTCLSKEQSYLISVWWGIDMPESSLNNSTIIIIIIYRPTTWVGCDITRCNVCWQFSLSKTLKRSFTRLVGWVKAFN